MSADDAYFVQLNDESQIVVQHGFMSTDDLPDPKKALKEETFDSIPEFANWQLENTEKINSTEYGLQFRINLQPANYKGRHRA